MTGSVALPAELSGLLDTLIQRARRRMHLRGAAFTGGAFTSALLVAMAGEAFLPYLPAPIRLLWPVWILSVAAVVGYRAWWRPLRRPLDRARMARLLEARHPEFDERLSTAVELGEDPDSGYSAGLLAEVVREATRFTGNIHPEQEFDVKALRRVGVLAATPLVVLLLLWAVWPGLVASLVGRVLLPLSARGTVWAIQLEVTPGDDVALRGSEWILSAAFTRPVSEPPVWEIREPDGTWSPQRLPRLDGEDETDPGYGLRLPALAESFMYRVRSGRIQSPDYQVTVVDPPLVTGMVATVHFPPYAGRDPWVVTNPVQRLTAMVGGEVVLDAWLSKPVAFANLAVMGQMQKVPVIETNRTLQARFLPERPGMSVLQWHLRDEHAFTGGSLPLELEVRDDQPPAVEIVQPVERELRMRPDDALAVRLFIEEDYGLAALDWEIALGNGPFEPRPANMPVRQSGRQTFYDARLNLPLSSLPLDQIPSIKVRLRATDNRPDQLGGGQHGVTETLEIVLDRAADRQLEKRLKEQYQEAREALRETEEGVKDAQRALDRAMEAAREKNPQQAATAAERALEKVQEAEAKAAEAEKELADSTFSETGEALKELRQDMLENARQIAEQAALAEDPRHTEQAATVAKEQLAEALEELQEIKEALEEKKEDVDRFVALNEQVAEQFGLAREAEEDTPDEKAWAREQEKVVDRVADLAKQDPADEAALTEALQEAREALGEQARSLADAQQAKAEASREAAEASPEDPAAPNPSLNEALAQEQDRLAEAIKEQVSAAAEQAAQEAAADAAESPGEQPGSPSEATQQAEQKAEQLQAASEQAEAAAEALREGDAEAAVDAAQAAAESLAEAVAGAPSEPEPGASANEGEAETAAASEPATPLESLAEQQSDFAEALAAAQEGAPEAALALGQEALSEAAQSLAEQGEALEALSDRLPGGETPTGESPPWEDVGETAAAAAELAGQSAEPSENFAGELAEAQAAAAEALAAAAESSSPAGESGEAFGEPIDPLAATGESSPPSGDPAPASGEPSPAAGEPMASSGEPAAAPLLDPALALESLQQAATAAARAQAAAVAPPGPAASPASPGTPAPPGPPSAAPAASAAAHAMQQLADAMGERLGVQLPESSPPSTSMGQVAQTQPNQGRGSSERRDADAEPMATGEVGTLDESALGDALQEWEAFLGEAGGGAAGGESGYLSRDYQELVRRYFEAVNRESIRSEGAEER